jgi:hypothetical protein
LDILQTGENSLFLGNNYRNTKKTAAMLEYAKVILPKVSFSRDLFRKELAKCINWVSESEIGHLKEWCFDNFREMYPDILTNAFGMRVA